MSLARVMGPPDCQGEHRFLVQFQAPSGQLGHLLEGQQTDQAAHFGLDVGTGPLADPIGRQFRVEPASLGASPFAGTPARRAVKGHHRDRQAPQKADHQGASFFQPGGAGPPPRRSLCQRGELSQAAHSPWLRARRHRGRPAAGSAREPRVPRRRSSPGRSSDGRAIGVHAGPIIARFGLPRRLVRVPAGRQVFDAFHFVSACSGPFALPTPEALP